MASTADTALCRLTLEALADAIARREVSPVEVTEAVLARIEALNPRLNAFVTVVPDRARAEARAAEREIAAGEWRGPLHGVPVGVKDLTATAGIRTTYGSAVFRDFVPDRDGGAVERLRAAGAVIVGKTAAHELGAGITTNNYWYGPTRNPWNPEHVPGGSSGGSAAAVAAEMVPVATGSDGGGSIRFPAAFCGVVGLKPTLGLVSNRGELGDGNLSFAVTGPIARTVRDTAILLKVLAGYDPEYVYSHPAPVPDYSAELERPELHGLRVGTSPDFLATPLDPDVRSAYAATRARLGELGATLVEVRIPHHHLVVPQMVALFATEGELALQRLIGDRPLELSPALVETRTMLGRLGVEQMVDIAHQRQLVRRDYAAAFLCADLLLLPAAPFPAPPIGANENELPPLYCPYTAAANVVGFPALVLPAGRARTGLPIGMQLLGPHFQEGLLLRAGEALFRAASEHRPARPPLD